MSLFGGDKPKPPPAPPPPPTDTDAAVQAEAAKAAEMRRRKRGRQSTLLAGGYRGGADTGLGNAGTLGGGGAPERATAA
jgi:hypothetical protein